MNNDNRNMITSRWLRSFLLLLIVYFIQVYPFYHLHHFHDDGLLEFEISSYPVKVDIEHSSGHHHDEDVPHTSNHQHTFDKHIDWHVTRAQIPRILSFDDQYSFPAISYIIADDNSIPYLDYQELQYIDDDYGSSLIIRGPPLRI